MSGTGTLATSNLSKKFRWYVCTHDLYALGSSSRQSQTPPNVLSYYHPFAPGVPYPSSPSLLSSVVSEEIKAFKVTKLTHNSYQLI